MKIVCIDNDCAYYLTLGKEYEVLSDEKKFYRILADNGEVHPYSKDRFDIV